MRLIDADAFDKYLEQAEIEATKSRKYVFRSAINTIRGNLANFPTVNQWIPCAESLPSDSDYYLVTDSFGDVSVIWFAHEKDYSGKSEWRETEDEILAWMPLPECYRGNSDEN